MIDGRIYASGRCVFAFCARGTCSTSFYIGVGTCDHVHLSHRGCIYGLSGNSETHPATKEEATRFYKIIRQAGYDWNQQTKEIINLRTNEIIQI